MSILRNSHRAIGVLAFTLLLLVAQPETVFSFGVQLRQRIVSRACILTTVVDENGMLHYILPPRCGMLVESGAATSSRSVVTYRFHGSLGVPPSEKTIKLLFWGSATYLETKASLQPLGGYVLLTNQMDRYSFKLAGDSLGGVPRTMEVVEIGSGSITIRFWPDNREVRLPLGKAVYVDIAHNSNADVILTLEQLNSDGNALIRVQFPDQDYLAGSAGERRNSLIAIAVTGSIVAGLVYVYLNSWLLKSRGLPPKDWWFVHHHEPF